MNNVSQTILDQYQIRKTGKQKAAFRAYLTAELEKAGYTVTVETSSILHNRNLIVGDPDTAEFIFTAHYDTCAVLPVPNFIAPRNVILTILYQVFLMILLIVLGGAIGALAGWITSNPGIGLAVAMIGMIVFSLLIILGPPNRHTVNDNTSGVITLTEALFSLPEAARGRAAFVFFDNEEMGLLGSSFFRQRHGGRIAQTPLINLDCVSDGDHILVVMGKDFRRDAALVEAVQSALVMPEGKRAALYSAATTFYPSDQMGFRYGAGIAAFHRAPVVGYYLGRVHTPFDTRLDAENVETLRRFILALFPLHP